MVIFHSYVSLPESQRVMTWMICGLPFRKPPSATATGCSWMWFFHHPQLKVYLSGFTTLFQMGTFKRNQPVEGRCVCFFFRHRWFFVLMMNVSICFDGQFGNLKRRYQVPYNAIFWGPRKMALRRPLPLPLYRTIFYNIVYIYIYCHIYILSN